MQLNQQQLEPSNQENLRQWLHQPMFELLIGQLQIKAFEKEVEAANKLKDWQGGAFPPFLDASQKSAKDAAEYNRTIEILKALRDQREPYYKMTATPA